MKSKGSLNSNEIKNDFPILSHEVNGQSLHYLDNAATTQKPELVLNAIDKYNRKNNANPHRGAHYLSVKATEKYEKGRERVKEFINANQAEEIIFTRNTTESLNLLAYSFAEKELESGDEVLISTAEHHSNILPWQQLSKRKDIKLKYLDINENGEIPFQEIKDKINKNTKILSITHMSNVTGLINDIQKITNYAHKKGVYVIVDGAQAVPHLKVDVQKLDVDFYAFSGHKMLGPMGIGVLYGKKDLLEEMPPFLTGGGMIEYVQKSSSSFAPIPERFEAGTPNVEGVVGLSAAIDYLEKIGMERVFEHEKKLLEYALNEMVKLDYLEIYGPKNIENKGGIISFNIEGVHSHDSATIIDSKGVAVRSGHHCAQPLMAELGINSALRASFYIYNDREDIDALIEGIKKAKEMFSNGS